mmetsp:Transcript_61543/g.70570  ORF Transcript_61543/g.70570 Transcript_61543/m.70570 type:complete len:227 (+) Transcript_61543:25-705(+)
MDKSQAYQYQPLEGTRDQGKGVSFPQGSTFILTTSDYMSLKNRLSYYVSAVWFICSLVPTVTVLQNTKDEYGDSFWESTFENYIISAYAIGILIILGFICTNLWVLILQNIAMMTWIICFVFAMAWPEVEKQRMILHTMGLQPTDDLGFPLSIFISLLVVYSIFSGLAIGTYAAVVTLQRSLQGNNVNFRLRDCKSTKPALLQSANFASNGVMTAVLKSTNDMFFQ